MAVPLAVRRIVRERAHSLCEYCHANECWQIVRFTIDHVDPQSAGGSDAAENLALACRNCNERRGNRRTVRDPISKRIVALFNPRFDRWTDHFIWSADCLHVVGLTPTGRATVAALDINDDRHGAAVVRVRRRDLNDGVHPPSADTVLSE